MGTPRVRSSTVVEHAGKLLVIVLADPTTKVERFYLPGGAIEAGETPVAAAERETLEETGYVIRTGDVVVREYPFNWDGEVYDCRTHYFRGYLVDPNLKPSEVDDAAYHRGVQWLPLAEVPEAFAYHGVSAEAIARLLRSGRPEK